MKEEWTRTVGRPSVLAIFGVEPSRGHRLACFARSSAVLLSLLAFLGLALPAGATATGPARFIVEKCDAALPGGGTEGVVFTGTSSYAGGNNCAEADGALEILQGAQTTTSSANWNVPLPPPPGGSVESVTVTGEMCNGTYHDSGIVAYAIQPGWPLTCEPETRTFTVNSTASSADSLYLGCEGLCEADPFVWAHYFAATVADPVAPTVERTGGTLVTESPIRGDQKLTAVAHDEGGGVSKMTVEVNGLQAATPLLPACRTAQVANPSVVGTVALSPTPCPAEQASTWTLDTSQAPFREGTNTVQVCAYDFATLGQPNEGCSAPQTVDVDNSCAESSVPGGTTLVAGFGRPGKKRLVVSSGRGAQVTGSLDDAAGRPVARATICLEVQTQGTQGQAVPIGTATTDAQGGFSYLLPPGPNRHVLVAYRHGSFQTGKEIEYLARARPSLRVRPGRVRAGGRVGITGKLPGPGAAGRVVVLQASALHGHRWLTFRRATSDKLGHFRATYRFGGTTRTTTYRFRAVVPHQSGYPYQSGHGQPIRVKVVVAQ